MDKHTVADVMTTSVVTVEPATPFKDVVDLLVGEGISAVPVVDRAGAVVGVVSEADLMGKQEHADQPEQRHPALLDGPRARRSWRQANGRAAQDVMTSPALTVPSTLPLPEAARRLANAHVRRLFVVDDGRLVGVLAGRDLLRDFTRPDKDIKAQIENDVFRRTLWAAPETYGVSVAHGVVVLAGRLEFQADAEIAAHLTRLVPGVVEVRDRLDWHWNGNGEHTEHQAYRDQQRAAADE